MTTSIYKTLSIACLALLVYSCGENKDLKDNFSITTSAKKNAVKNGGEITLSLKAKKNIAIDSVSYTVDGKKIGTTILSKDYTATIKTTTLGHKKLQATVYTSEGTETIEDQIIVLNTTAPKIYGYKIINRFPHKTDAYTQGLEFVGDTLYESTGEYGKSKLRKVNYKTGKVYKEVALDNAYFAEGLTVLNDNIYQLTWKENTGFIYDVSTLAKKGTFAYDKSKQGWGLSNDGTHIYKSDGTSKIWTLNATTLSETSYIEPTDNTGVKSKFNELEFINGKLYANTYQVASIAIINPENGAIEGIIDMRSIVKEVQSGLDKQNEVLNGIAYKANENRLFVTGKHWNTLFEIEVVEK